jgi:hypothetical protein
MGGWQNDSGVEPMLCETMKELQRAEAAAMDGYRQSCDHRRKARYALIFREAQRLQVEHEEACEMCKKKVAA